MNDRDELAQILRRLEAAENAADTDYIVSMMADDMVIMVPNVAVQEGKDVCAEFLRGMHLRRRLNQVAIRPMHRGNISGCTRATPAARGSWRA